MKPSIFSVKAKIIAAAFKAVDTPGSCLLSKHSHCVRHGESTKGLIATHAAKQCGSAINGAPTNVADMI